jgi:HK97 family phage portal protein
MGILSTLLGARRSLENPSTSLSDPDDWLWDALGAKGSAAGVRVNRETALGYSPVWRGVNLLSRDVAKLPLLKYVRQGEGKERDKKHPLFRLLRRRPNREMTAFTFKQTLMGHALLEGNGLAYIFRRGDGTPDELIPLLPGTSYPVRVAGKLWYVTEVGGEQRKLLPENVFHVKGLGFDGLSGYRLIDKARESLGLGIAAREYGARYFSNNAEARVVIEHPKHLTPEAAKRMKDGWDKMHGGLENAHRTAILEEGASAKVISSTARNSQLLETRAFEIREVANWIGVPPHKLGDTTRTAFASLEQENQSYLDDALDPWLVNWEEESYEKLLSEEEKDSDEHVIEFLREALVRANLVDRANYYRTALGGRPWMKQNEVRARENLNPVEGGDDIKDPLNMGDAGGADNQPADNKPPPAKDESKSRRSPAADDDDDEDEDAENDDPANHARAAIAAGRTALIDVLRRMVRRVTTHARRAQRSGNYDAFAADGASDEHRDVIVEALGPIAGVLQALTRRDVDPHALADQVIRDVVANERKPDAQDLSRTLPEQLADRTINGA